MDKWESTQNIGGISNRDAKDIYKWATGKELSEEGIFGVEPTGLHKYGPGSRGKGWVDPRMDHAVQARWEDPRISLEEALRTGGFEFPPLGEKGVSEKKILDSEGVSIADRKGQLKRQLVTKKRQLEKKAAVDPEAAREYEARYPPGEAVGSTRRGIPPARWWKECTAGWT